MEAEETTILKSIALSHLLNGYVKVFTGELAPICGCAIAAGVGATAAITYQQRGNCVPAVTLAINNIISDIGGMLCDGAKSGCALKVVSSTDAAIRSAYMAIHDYGITEVEGFVGRTAEETIQNLGNKKKAENGNDNSEGGRPEKADDEKTEKTIQNKESQN